VCRRFGGRSLFPSFGHPLPHAFHLALNLVARALELRLHLFARAFHFARRVLERRANFFASAFHLARRFLAGTLELRSQPFKRIFRHGSPVI
jgi:hypothetical protein